MDGKQSKEKTSTHKEETKDTSSQHTESPTEPSYRIMGTDFKTKTQTEAELPQCQMGSKKVDDMAFMISCTN
ncbi:hypothetical protein DPEC_G00208280 [Dallia pectoralis]|uniref:Uncharacterized protein n=1 Tax=Dallia pectoralis TaxID=75939 RepID=A0ACC2G5B5_DALPE|nr:hypothetical protein DPEC_G00208280 [Dallia pectoralis]